MATIQEVASAAGVSVGTVSRYLNGYQLKPANEERIERAIAALDYHPNSLARSLRRQRSCTVGLLVNNMLNHFATSVVASIEREMELHDYTIMLSGFRNDHHVFAEKLRLLLDRQIDGLIVFETDEGWDELRLLDEVQIPLVFVGSPVRCPRADQVLVNDQPSAERVMAEMIACGHDRPGIICGPQREHVARERLNGCLAAIDAAGLPRRQATVIEGGYSRQCGYEAMNALLVAGVDAVFCCNYGTGQGALQAVSERGLRVGEDLSYASFDYFDLSPLFYPRITTICPPSQKIGTYAARHVLELIDHETLGTGRRETFADQILWQPSIIGLDRSLWGTAESLDVRDA
ncbi:LacI family DNA-binding transcriptional regulator [Olsenella sp. YH-ols2217]|uniref:LacI family DNA-binding transcriptional regulator n=1 Tax=Kribbibacterium absianum TaxID=3044210 RepID=A0ABT6ZMD9_9ACTN|nr:MULTISPECIES: LacI family DNA-binding transcriptional regulator [unclassified Olsenella]MDJ1122210.1 LacI family DNA-binding transcriptional regulator [Olsenella sp. YH-ols2216]MDJ1130218.1 LacI family DNA-binding transcriptional regulator [Olsenella sp. YH-ols2217]